jgi:hypothetical protein
MQAEASQAGETQIDTIGVPAINEVRHVVPCSRPRDPEEYVFFECELPALGLREGIALRLRAGMVDGHNYTLEEVGVIFGVGRERARQIQQAALLACRNQRSASSASSSAGDADLLDPQGVTDVGGRPPSTTGTTRLA